MSGLFQLHAYDLTKGLVVAILSSVFATLSAIVQNKGFDLTKADALGILATATVAGLGYLAKQLLTDDNGRIVGKI